MYVLKLQDPFRKKIYSSYRTGLVQSSFINIVQDIFEFVPKIPKGHTAKNSKIFCTMEIYDDWCNAAQWRELEKILKYNTIGPDKSWVVFFFEADSYYYVLHKTHTHTLNVCHNVVMSVPPMNCTMKFVHKKKLHIESYYINQKMPS